MSKKKEPEIGMTVGDIVSIRASDNPTGRVMMLLTNTDFYGTPGGVTNLHLDGLLLPTMTVGSMDLPEDVMREGLVDVEVLLPSWEVRQVLRAGMKEYWQEQVGPEPESAPTEEKAEDVDASQESEESEPEVTDAEEETPAEEAPKPTAPKPVVKKPVVVKKPEAPTTA